MAKDPKPLDLENSSATATKVQKPYGFQLGNRVNPGGRPKGLAAAIREKWPADKLRDAFTEVAENPKTNARDRMEALRWLGERGYGKTPETHLVGTLTEEQRDAAAELSRDQLLALIDGSPSAALPGGGASEEVIDGQVSAITGVTE